MKVLTESILPFTCSSGGWSIRVWREEPSGDVASHDDIDERVKKLNRKKFLKAKPIAKALIEMERVNAVEVKDFITGVGIVVYKDWP